MNLLLLARRRRKSPEEEEESGQTEGKKQTECACSYLEFFLWVP